MTALAAATVGCAATEPEEAAVGQAELRVKGCPAGLIDLVRSDEHSGWLEPNVADSCMNVARGTLRDAYALEGYLSRHPFVQLNQTPHHLSLCLAQYEIDHRSWFSSLDIPEEQRRATVASYYFLMNSLKQAALSTMEAIAGLDMVLAPGREVLPASSGPYADGLIDESSDWEKRLRRNCRGERAGFDALVETTNVVLWNVRKLNAGLEEHRSVLRAVGRQEFPSPAELEEAAKASSAISRITKTRDAIVGSFAPWLLGREMDHLMAAPRSLEETIALENRYGIVDESGNVAPRSEWKLGGHYQHPMNLQEAEVRKALPKQLAANREGLVRRLRQIRGAADFLHENRVRMSARSFQEVMEALEPFDLRVFTNYYGSSEVAESASTTRLDELDARARAIASAHAGRFPFPDTQDLNAVQHIAALEAFLRLLSANGVGDEGISAELAQFTETWLDRSRALSATAALGAAECRNAVRSSRETVARAKHDFIIGATVTVATAGMGSWLAAARAATVAGPAAEVGLQWANAARVSSVAARGAQAVSQVLKYHNQARILWGTLLAADAYWLGEGVYYAVKACNESLYNRYPKAFDVPFDIAKVSCLESGDSLSRNAISDYQTCALSAALSVGLNALTLLPAARELKHGPLGPPPRAGAPTPTQP